MLPLEVDWSAVAAVIGAGLLLVGTLLTLRAARADKRIDATAKNYDQLQEDLAEMRKTQLVDRSRINELERVDRLKDNYIANLRAHIYADAGAPPPDWPAELTRHP